MTTTPSRPAPATFAERVERLNEPINPNRVMTREVARGRYAPYIEGFDVIDHANYLFGYDGWSTDVLILRPIATVEVTRTVWEDRKPVGERQVPCTVYEAHVKVTVHALNGVWKTDVGTSTSNDDTPEAHETAIKGAVTDAKKRALRELGNQFGNSLYDKSAPPAEAEPQQPQQQQTRPTGTGGGDKLPHEGALWTWASTTIGLPKTRALEVRGVKEAVEAGDLEAARDALRMAYPEKAGAR